MYRPRQRGGGGERGGGDERGKEIEREKERERKRERERERERESSRGGTRTLRRESQRLTVGVFTKTLMPQKAFRGPTACHSFHKTLTLRKSVGL